MPSDARGRQRTEAGVRVLRVGVAGICAIVIALGRPAGRELFEPAWLDAAALGVLAGAAALVAAGRFVRAAAGIGAALCAAAAASALLAHRPWFSLPVRDAELAIAFLALSLLAPDGQPPS